ncbi:MAG: peptide chain release factor 3, partial [Clostridia bacterium]|nr:peptide chain release factor 3 [Clostridia bacterium]
GIFTLGQSLSLSGDVQFEGIPLFAPEFFYRVTPLDTMKRKAFVRGMQQLSEEGAVQLFRQPDIGREEWMAGVVGVLQIDVMVYRLRGEYGVETRLEPLPYHLVRWVVEGEAQRLPTGAIHAEDQKGRPVVLFEHQWSLPRVLSNNEGLVLSDIAPR